jgi:hypothetical protein
MNRFIEQSQVVPTNNYNSIIRLHTLMVSVTTAHKIKSSISAFTSRILATDLNTETITISLDYTFQVLHKNEVFK